MKGLKETLDRARVLAINQNERIVEIWSGKNHAINTYQLDRRGNLRETNIRNVGSFEKDTADQESVVKSMRENLANPTIFEINKLTEEN